ncbi:MAG: calcium-binding protein [Nitrososphaeraceae archaeon]|jgi:Ca2+-binding RTX toxin-like protein
MHAKNLLIFLILRIGIEKNLTFIHRAATIYIFIGLLTFWVSQLTITSIVYDGMITATTTTATTLLSAEQTPQGNDTEINQSNIQSLSSSENLRVGSFGDDRITGTNEDDIIVGLSGSDTINGGGGDDKIQGNEDSDKLYGDEGNDVLQGGVGSDQIYGREGDDVIVGGLDDDYLVGDEGNDKLYGSEGDDILIGGTGADYFDCGEGTDVVTDFNITENDDNAGNCEEILGTETISVR